MLWPRRMSKYFLIVTYPLPAPAALLHHLAIAKRCVCVCVCVDIRTGKVYLKGYDRAGNPIMYMVPSREVSSVLCTMS